MAKSIVKLSKNLLRWLNCSSEREEQLRRELDSRIRTICKPCWELKYCPYGPLVEEFPLPPLTIVAHNEHTEYLKKCLVMDAMGDNFDVPLDDTRRELFKKVIEEADTSDCVERVSEFEQEASCKEFGHLCPVFFVGESFSETEKGRKRSRNIARDTFIRVVRRDNNTCQICGRVLLDREIEIDHVIPFSRGGNSDESNLRVSCRECNRKKGKKINL